MTLIGPCFISCLPAARVVRLPIQMSCRFSIITPKEDLEYFRHTWIIILIFSRSSQGIVSLHILCVFTLENVPSNARPPSTLCLISTQHLCLWYCHCFISFVITLYYYFCCNIMNSHRKLLIKNLWSLLQLYMCKVWIVWSVSVLL